MPPPVFPRSAPVMFIIFMIGSLDCLCLFWLVGATIGHFPVDSSLHFKARLSANSLIRCTTVHQNVRSRIFSRNCGRIFQSCRRTSHSTSEQGLEHFMSASNSKSTLQRTARLAIVWRISKHWNHLYRKFELLARSTSEQFVSEIPKQSHIWILNDFCFTGFSEIYLAYLLYRLKQENFSQKYQQFFLPDAIFFKQ